MIFFGLTINFFVQLIRKGQMHINLYRKMNLVDDDVNHIKTYLTGTFYKCPLAMVPYVEKFENLSEDEEALYEKLKFQLFILWVSILALVGFFVYVFINYK